MRSTEPDLGRSGSGRQRSLYPGTVNSPLPKRTKSLRQAVFGAHGHLFTVDAPEAVLAFVDTALSTMRVTASVPTGRYAVRDGQGHWELRWCDEVIGQRTSVDAIVLLMQWHVNQLVIARSTRSNTTFHAAAARSRRGHGALLAAPMESGKTTTVTGLLQAGWEYLSDEAVGVDSGGVMWAYPKPLTIDRGSWPLFPALRPRDACVSAPSWLVPATTIGCIVAPSAPLRLVIFPAYRAGFVTALEMVTAAEAAMLLSRSTFFFDENGARDLRCVARLARTVPAYRLAIGDLAAAVRLIEELDERLEVEA